MFSDTVIISIISTFGGVIIAYIVNVVAKKNKASKPKDRMESIFDGYDKLIIQQQDDIKSKTTHINHLQELIDKQREQLQESQEMIDGLKDELEIARGRNQELRDQLNLMKKNYRREIPTQESR